MNSEHLHEHHHHHEDRSRRTRPRKPLHRDWRLIAAVLVMLGAVAIYVFSGDEMFGLFPKGKPNNAPSPPAQQGTSTVAK
jgi:hypothetical protein